MQRSFTSLLFVPANRPERFDKAADAGADAIILDLEDAVPVEAKESARAALRAGFTKLPIVIRINAENTPWHADDVVAASSLPIAGIVVPKVELGGGIVELAARSSKPIFALVETAKGLSQARKIAALPGVVQLIFGSVDFCADLGLAHTREALLAARSELVLASRLAGLPSPVDGVTTTIDDPELIRSDARYALELGFGGKLAIHPKQIPPIRQGFMPTAAEINWCRGVLASGDGAVAVAGTMVDEPVRIRARSILARAGLR